MDGRSASDRIVSHMAATPTIDLASLDLDQLIAGPAELDAHLQQTDRFRMLDGIVYEDLEEGIVVGIKNIRSDDWWAKDHVPGRPMFPGVLQIECAAQLCTYDYAAHRMPEGGDKEQFIGFGGVEKVRFRRIVQPDCQLVMVTNLTKASRRMFRYNVQGFVEGEMVFEGDIIGVLI